MSLLLVFEVLLLLLLLLLTVCSYRGVTQQLPRASSKGNNRKLSTQQPQIEGHALKLVSELSAHKFKVQNGPSALSLGRGTIVNRRYHVFIAVIAITAAVIIWRILALALLVSSVACSQGSCTPTMSLSSLSRARAAVLGSFVADAATVGVHWIYDQSKVNIH
jgi:hypothetical protein